jgi:hypothetical protein
MPFQFRKEAIEEDLNSNFPSQGQGNPPLYYSLSEVVVPTYSINNVAEGSSLPEFLQRAVDFSTGNVNGRNTGTTQTIISNPGFWRIWGYISASNGGSVSVLNLSITDGVSTKQFLENQGNGANLDSVNFFFDVTVFVRSGDSITLTSASSPDNSFAVNYRQVAELNGTLVNPLGYSAA